MLFKMYRNVLMKRHMHQISDGERRRVQLCMGLMTEWDVLLLDEVCSHALGQDLFEITGGR